MTPIEKLVKVMTETKTEDMIGDAADSLPEIMERLINAMRKDNSDSFIAISFNNTTGKCATYNVNVTAIDAVETLLDVADAIAKQAGSRAAFMVRASGTMQ